MKPIALAAFQDNYIWVINTEESGFICVDPGDAKPVLAYAHQHSLNLKQILLTHHHQDHIGGVHDLLTVFPKAQVYAPDDQRIPEPKTCVGQDDTLVFGQITFQVLFTPGHTRSHICFYEANLDWLFCGDTLFSAGCGRVLDGTMETLHDSLLKLSHLPNQTQIYCGHEYTRKNLRFAALIEPDNSEIKSYLKKLNNQTTPLSLPSTMGLEKQLNPFLRTSSQEVQEHARQQGINTHNNLAIFRCLREEKDKFN